MLKASIRSAPSTAPAIFDDAHRTLHCHLRIEVSFPLKVAKFQCRHFDGHHIPSAFVEPVRIGRNWELPCEDDIQTDV